MFSDKWGTEKVTEKCFQNTDVLENNMRKVHYILYLQYRESQSLFNNQMENKFC